MSHVIHLAREIHQETSSRRRKGRSVRLTTRWGKTACGQEVRQEVEGERVGPLVTAGLTGWGSLVTCPDCLTAPRP